MGKVIQGRDIHSFSSKRNSQPRLRTRVHTRAHTCTICASRRLKRACLLSVVAGGEGGVRGGGLTFCELLCSL